MKNYFRDAGLVLSVVSLTVASVAMLIFTYSASLTAFCIFAPILFLTAGFTAAKLITVTRQNFQYFAHIDEEIGQMERVSLTGLPLSIAIVDKTGKLIWYNDEFLSSFEEEAVYGSPIETITKLGLDKLLEKESYEIGYKDGYYNVYASAPSESEAREIYMIYFKNITRLRVLETEKKMSQPVVIVFIIDSYDELFGGSAESETANITVQIDKLLEDFISEASGILRKYGKERFWAVVEEKYVRAMIDEKVKILDRVREIQVNDRINVTLSIGIGRTAKTLAESEDFAKQALDMALGRGGDQAAIKTENGFEFFGGVSKGIERHTKVKTRIIANSLIEAIETSDEIYIMGHRNSDLDSVGSSVGLAAAIRRLGKTAYAVIDAETTLSTRLYDYIRENEEGGIFLSPADAKLSFSDGSLLIVVDTHNPKIVDDAELLERAKKIVVIDHHRKMVNFIDNAMIFHHEPYASSASEMVTELLQYFGDAGKIGSVYADALLSGITLDTKNFTLRTGVRTFEAAAFLRKIGADTVSVKALFANSIECYKEKSELVSSASVYRSCAISVTEKTGGDMRLAAPQAADELLGVSDVNASFVISRTGADEVAVSCRSLGIVNVQLIAELLGGGGHQTMAGAQFRGESTDEVLKKLKEAIDKYYESLNS
ncbi:MAG: DHH family phosphoesterase [Bacteroides sp.]|nr:DHH family phosphoesterase [Eubacterium sp.]MCM1418262.1 DHH family phosphoesterase [Roseburia sp.]MCM1462355.1 DHH family phosphoesterase [Bacteroides sp.]